MKVMKAKKYAAILNQIKFDKFVKVRECFEVVKHLGGRIETCSGSLHKIFLNDKMISVHWHSQNDFVKRDTWKLMGLR